MPSGLAPVVWCGWQETKNGPSDLWTLTRDVPEHSAGSTVSGDTLRALGYRLPLPPSPPTDTEALNPPAAGP